MLKKITITAIAVVTALLVYVLFMPAVTVAGEGYNGQMPVSYAPYMPIIHDGGTTPTKGTQPYMPEIQQVSGRPVKVTAYVMPAYCYELPTPKNEQGEVQEAYLQFYLMWCANVR